MIYMLDSRYGYKKHCLYLNLSINNIYTPLKRVKIIYKNRMLSSHHLNVDTLLVLINQFQFGYFGFWYFGSRNLGTVHLLTKFGSISVGLFWILVWFSSKIENHLICKQNFGSNSVPVRFLFLGNYGFIDKNIIWGFSLTIGKFGLFR